MNETTGFWSLFGDLITVAASDKLIWIPVAAGWLFGFFYSMWLKVRREKRLAAGKMTLRQLELELHVYAMNAGVAFLLYCLFNWSGPVTVQQGLLAAVVAVFMPLAWFKLIKPVMHRAGS